MQGKCDYIESIYSEQCQNERRALFCSELSGITMWVCETHFQRLREYALQERKALSMESKAPAFDERSFAAARGREY